MEKSLLAQTQGIFKPNLHASIRAWIYDYLESKQLIISISKLSKTERKLLAKNASQHQSSSYRNISILVPSSQLKPVGDYEN